MVFDGLRGSTFSPVVTGGLRWSPVLSVGLRSLQ